MGIGGYIAVGSLVLLAGCATASPDREDCAIPFRIVSNYKEPIQGVRNIVLKKEDATKPTIFYHVTIPPPVPFADSRVLGYRNSLDDFFDRMGERLNITMDCNNYEDLVGNRINGVVTRMVDLDTLFQ